MTVDGGQDVPKGFPLEEQVDRMCALANRTSLTTIDAVLKALPRGRLGQQEAALEVAVAARRMVTATADFKAAASPPQP